MNAKGLGYQLLMIKSPTWRRLLSIWIVSWQAKKIKDQIRKYQVLALSSPFLAWIPNLKLMNRCLTSLPRRKPRETWRGSSSARRAYKIWSTSKRGWSIESRTMFRSLQKISSLKARTAWSHRKKGRRRLCLSQSLWPQNKMILEGVMQQRSKEKRCSII